jgi:hypothetical protein
LKESVLEVLEEEEEEEREGEREDGGERNIVFRPIIWV